MLRLGCLVSTVGCLVSAVSPLVAADVRLSNDALTTSMYISAYTLATGNAYTDAVIAECSQARGRQNEPAVAMNPRDPRVIVGSSNDYCGVYAGSPVNGVFVPSGPVWLGYYRSENSGASFQSSLVPGYPGDTSPYAKLAQVRTSGAGDPVMAWDRQGRLFMAAESSGDPAGTKKTFGDEWVARFENPAGPGGSTLNDGKEFKGSVVVAKGSAAPDLLGKFHDKTSIEVDRRRIVRRICVFCLVAIYRQQLQHLPGAVNRPRCELEPADAAHQQHTKRAGSGYSGDRKRARLCHIRPGRNAERPIGGCLVREIRGLRAELR